MGWLGSAVFALVSAVAIAQLGPYAPIHGSVFEPWPEPMRSVTSNKALVDTQGSRVDRGKATSQAPAAPAGPPAPTAESHPHDPLVTFYFSTTALRLQQASPQQQPATHVALLPLAGMAPLTATTCMPSDLGQVSSSGYETYMVRTAEFFQVNSLTHVALLPPLQQLYMQRLSFATDACVACDSGHTVLCTLTQCLPHLCSRHCSVDSFSTVVNGSSSQVPLPRPMRNLVSMLSPTSRCCTTPEPSSRPPPAGRLGGCRLGGPLEWCRDYS
jgi:hypothetical protein